MSASQLQALLDFFLEPVIVLGIDGVILEANSAARRALGADLVGRDLATFLASPEAEYRTWLKRCSGTTTPLVGALHLRQPDGGTRHVRLRGARLRPSDETVHIAVRFLEIEPRRFQLLKREVEELNATARESMRREAVLAEALRNNQAMLSELNHRVKNNIQLMVGMLSATGRETSSPEVREAVRVASRRLLAVGAAQRLMYETPEVTTVAASSLLRTLVDSIAAMQGRDLPLEVAGTDGQLPNEMAFPLAIIINELVMDVARSGAPDGGGTIRIALAGNGDEFEVSVHGDPAISTTGPESRSSGLGLVRGLCNQIGGEVDVLDGGTHFALRFTCPQREGAA